MTDASTSFELVEFEQVQAGPRTVLLRLATRPSEAFTLAGLALVLDGDGDGDAVRLTPLPGPPGAADLLRAAFAAAPELLAGSTTYSLELADGSLVALPAPTQRSATRHPTPAAAPPEHPDAPRLAEAEQRAASRRLAIVELQRRLSAEHSRRSAAEAEARTARAAATAEAAAHVELRTRLADAEADSERLRTALDEATHSAAAEAQAAAALSTQVAELEAAAASAEELRAQLTELECRLEDEQAQLEAAESDVRAGREQFAGVEAELAGVRAAAEEVAAALADRTTEVELLREAAVARERELEEQLVAQRRKFEAELADRPGPAQAPEPLAQQPDAFDSVADALLAGAAEVELLRIATSKRPEAVVAESQDQLDAARREAAEAQRELVDAREQLAAAQSEKTELQRRLDQAIEARNLPPEAQAYERELVELRGAVERAQNRARLHRQHSNSLELELTEAKQELTELRHQVAAVTSSGEVAPVEEIEALREQVAYGEALAADLEWHLEEARVTEEAAEAVLAIRAAEVELLSIALRELSATAGDEHE